MLERVLGGAPGRCRAGGPPRAGAVARELVGRSGRDTAGAARAPTVTRPPTSGRAQPDADQRCAATDACVNPPTSSAAPSCCGPQGEDLARRAGTARAARRAGRRRRPSRPPARGRAPARTPRPGCRRRPPSLRRARRRGSAGSGRRARRRRSAGPRRRARRPARAAGGVEPRSTSRWSPAARPRARPDPRVDRGRGGRDAAPAQSRPGPGSACQTARGSLAGRQRAAGRPAPPEGVPGRIATRRARAPCGRRSTASGRVGSASRAASVSTRGVPGRDGQPQHVGQRRRRTGRRPPGQGEHLRGRAPARRTPPGAAGPADVLAGRRRARARSRRRPGRRTAPGPGRRPSRARPSTPGRA